MFDIADSKTIASHLSTAGADVYTCPADRMAHINLLQITNVDGNGAADFTGSVYVAVSGVTSYFAYFIPIPAKAAYTPLGEKLSLWLKAGDKIHLSASADGDLDSLLSVMEYYLPE